MTSFLGGMFALAAAFVPASFSADHGLAEMSHARDIGVRFLGCELLASGRILADASSRLQLVDSEASHVYTEARTLAEIWRREGGGAVDKRLADREVWRAVEASGTLESGRIDAARALARAEKSWKSFKKTLARDLARGGDGQRLSPEADKMIGAAQAALTTVSRAAGDLRSAQDLLDGALSLAGISLRPWHHNYRDNGLPRPDYRLDFAGAWETEMEKAHHELRPRWKR